jgi:FkbM family methyltransferase
MTDKKRMKYYSQYYQDFFIDFLFKKKSNGIFVDIGAHNGISISNSYFFEQQRDWKGVCIEPNPVVFQKLQANRNVFVYNCCIAALERTVIFRKVSGAPEMLSGILEFFDNKHIERINREIAQRGGSYEDIEIKCRNINNIMHDCNFYNIDYCSIDTEGAELEIVKSIDLDIYNITAFSIEGDNKEVINYLRSKGYVCITSICDNLFIKKGTKRIFALTIMVVLGFFAMKTKKYFNILKKYFKKT